MTQLLSVGLKTVTSKGNKMKKLILLVTLITMSLLAYAGDRILYGEIVTSQKSNQDITITPTGTGDLVLGGFTGILEATTGAVSISATSPTELGYLIGSTQNIQTALDAAGAILPIDLTTDVGTSILPVANGGTGSATQNYVDLTSGQSVAGNKAFSGVTSFGNVRINNVANTIDSTSGFLLLDSALGIIKMIDTVELNNQTASTVPILNPSKQLVSSTITDTELGYLTGVTQNVQTGLNAKLETVDLASDVGATILPVANGGTGSATRNFVDLTSSETVAGTKTFSSDVLMSGTGQIDLPTGTTGERSGTPNTGMLRYNSTLSTFEGYGTEWGPLAGAGGVADLDFYHSEEYETTVTGDWSTGNNATILGGGTLVGALSTTQDLISGTSFTYTHHTTTATVNDYWCSEALTLDKKQKDNYNGYSFHHTYDGADDDIQIIVWDVTNAKPLTSSFDLVKNKGSPKKYFTTFYPPTNATDISYCFQVLVTNANKILIWDDTNLSTNPINIQDQIETHDYTITQAANAMSDITSELEFNLGTATISDSGENIIVAEDDSGNTRTKFVAQRTCEIVFSASGKLATALRSLSITKNGTVIMSGSAVNSANGMNGVSGPLKLNAGDYITVGTSLEHSIGGGSLTNDAVNFKVSFTATAETEHVITSTNVIPTSKVNTSSSSAVTSLINTFVGFGTTEFDANSLFTNVGSANNGTYTSTTYYTAPSPGKYRVTSSLYTTDVDLDSTEVYEIRIYVNGVLKASRRKNTETTLASPELSTTIDSVLELDRDDDISIGFFQVSGADVTLVSNSTSSHFTVEKIDVSGELAGFQLERVAYLKNVQAAGTSGGSATTTFTDLVLNDVSGDTEIVSLASNRFTLSPGKYEIEAHSICFDTENTTIQLYDVSNTTALDPGMPGYNPAANENTVVVKVFGTVTITESTEFSVQQKSVVAKIINGRGVAANLGVDEVFVTVKITKLR